MKYYTFKEDADLRKLRRILSDLPSFEQQVGMRVSGMSIYCADGFVYFTCLTNMRRFGCKMNGSRVVRVFPQV